MGLHDKKIEGASQFVSYFEPVVKIMRDLGGEAKPRQVLDEIIQRYDIPEAFLALMNKKR